MKTADLPKNIRVTCSGDGRSWRFECDRCIQERIVPSRDHCRAVAFVKDHSHCGAAREEM